MKNSNLNFTLSPVGRSKKNDAYLTTLFEKRKQTDYVEHLVDRMEGRKFDLNKERISIPRKSNNRTSSADITQISESLKSNDIFFVNGLKHYILDNIESDLLNLTSMAHHLNMSVSTFERKVKRIKSLSPGKLIQELRLSLAYDLLISKPLWPICRIATKVGFKNSSSFARSFKRKYDCAPKDVKTHRA